MIYKMTKSINLIARNGIECNCKGFIYMRVIITVTKYKSWKLVRV